MIITNLQDNYDDDQIDPYHGKQEEQQAPDDLDLPDDLNLDDDNDDGGKDDEKEMEETGTIKIYIIQTKLVFEIANIMLQNIILQLLYKSF